MTGVEKLLVYEVGKGPAIKKRIIDLADYVKTINEMKTFANIFNNYSRECRPLLRYFACFLRLHFLKYN